MRKEERGEERDMTMYLIYIQIFTHASHVTKFSPYELLRKDSCLRWGCSVGSSPLKLPRLSAEMKRKAFG